MSNDLDSPTELAVHGRVRGVTRFNRVPVLLGGGVVAVFLIAVMVGLATRNDSGGEQSPEQASLNTKLKPEVGVQRDFLKDAPMGVILPPKVEEKPKLPEEPTKKAEVPDLAAPPLVGKKDATPAQRIEPQPPQAPSAQEEAIRRALEEMEKVRLAAFTASSAVGQEGGGFGTTTPVAAITRGGSAAGGGPQSSLLQLAEAAKALGLAGPGGGGGGGAPAGAGLPGAAGLMPQMGGGEEADPNKQERKETFLSRAQQIPESNYVKSTRTPPLNEFEIKAGWTIPAVMEHGINSDLPGQVTARVSQNVYDTATGKYLLIPQGTRVVGEYDSQVAFGQEGLLVVWRRLIFPDASSMNIGGMGGYDEGGYSGFRDQVNHHYARIFGWGLLTSLFGVAYQLSQPTNTVNPATNTATVNNQQIAAASVGQEMARLGSAIARKNLNIQPTIEIRPGYRFFVRVEKDLIMPRPYAYGNVQQ